MADETQGGAAVDDRGAPVQDAPQTQNQTQTKPAEKQPAEKTSAIAEQKLSITVAEWQEREAKLAEYEQYKRAEAERDEKKNQEKLRLMADKEGADKALQTQREQLKLKEKEWEDRYNSLQKAIGDEKIEAAISEAMTGLDFIGKTREVKAAVAADFRNLLRSSSQLKAVQDSQGKWTVRDENGRAAKDALAELIKAKSYLIATDVQGGVANGGGFDASADDFDVANDFHFSPNGNLALKGL